MKHVQESLSQYYDYKFFKVFEEDEKAELQDKEKDGLAVIDKIQKNFDDFKNSSKGEILKYKEFWEENLKSKEAFSDGDIYKMFDGNYVVGVMELPVETLSDGSIEGGMGATDEPEEEIIEGKEVPSGDDEEQPKEDFFEEVQVPNPAGAKPAGPAVTNEAEGEEEDLDLDLTDDPAAEGGEDLNLDISEPTGGEEGGEEVDLDLDKPADDMGGEEVDLDMEAPAEEMPAEEPVDTTPDMNAPQKYFVVYDISGDEREEIFRTGSNNVVNAFNTFYNDTFKGAMKDAIIKHKEKKMVEKKEAEKSEKAKVETDKQSKIKKFLGESQRNYLNAVHTLKDLKD